MNIIVYSTPTCPSCRMLKDFLSSNKVDYINNDVTQAGAARDYFISKGWSHVPVTEVKIGNEIKIINGFNQAEIKKILSI